MNQNTPSSVYQLIRGLPKVGVKLFIMLLLSAVAFGVTGMGVILLMFALSYVAIGRDSEASHGISSTDSSRLGGLAIAFVFGIYILGLTLGSPYTPGVARESVFLYLWIAIGLCALLGLVEDVQADFLTPFFRLSLKFAVFGWLLWVAPELLPRDIGIFGVDKLLEIPVLAYFMVTVFCVGFINAFNMADGANGLIPGIAAATFTVFFFEYGRPAEGLLMFVCVLFLIFNVVSGWYFLGDMGSYGLGSIIVCYGLLGVAQGDFSASFMASILAYPCIDFVYSIVRRVREGLSPFSADNGHLHNRLHRYYSQFFKSRVLPNSLTGLTISGSTAGVCVLIYLFDGLSLESNTWFYVFFLEAAVYFVVISALRRSQS
jgi:UDP-N-acetylmuramyl pentapeptide phosphotransferase/UDP-N-acetylglucosamine-1-phosphate transferase